MGGRGGWEGVEGEDIALILLAPLPEEEEEEQERRRKRSVRGECPGG